MIVALAGAKGDGAASALARELAALRIAHGSRVLLMPPSARMTQTESQQCYDDVVIDLSDSDTEISASMLAAAGVIVVLLQPQQLECAHHECLLEKIKTARWANRTAPVLVAVGHADKALSAHEAGCLLVFVARIGAARLADTLVLGGDGTYRLRHDARQPCAQPTAMSAHEVRHLYRQIFDGAPALQ